MKFAQLRVTIHFKQEVKVFEQPIIIASLPRIDYGESGDKYQQVDTSNSAHHDYKYSVLMKKSLDILTIVVPPALPAVMTTGLFLAQLRLKKQGIFCLNPSAINIAGTLNTIVFDKVRSGFLFTTSFQL
ncbi:unnamed protein product [Schistocephalus solidus]|uniref:Uncharacterized protein n=1 Tax=Schistocephalus solidus TaxID=70667 RepID=A0A3P7F5T7_SCHSO|nr:unnamed protein product [Schistocephalus solidus]